MRGIPLPVIVACLCMGLTPYPLSADDVPTTPPKTRLVIAEKLLLHDDFSAPDIAKHWDVRAYAKHWSVRDGVLRGDGRVDGDAHAPVMTCALPVRDVILTCRVRIPEGDPYLLLLVDGETANGEKDHLLRWSMTNRQLTFAQDLGPLASKRERQKRKAELAKQGQPLPPPTPAELADPAFHRTEPLARRPFSREANRWYTLTLEVAGSDALAVIDGEPVLFAETKTLDAGKSVFHFLVGKGDVDIDDVTIWSARLSDDHARQRAEWKSRFAEKR